MSERIGFKGIAGSCFAVFNFSDGRFCAGNGTLLAGYLAAQIIERLPNAQQRGFWFNATLGQWLNDGQLSLGQLHAGTCSA